MPNYIEFTTEDGGTVLVEVQEHEVAPRGGVSKAGLGEKLDKNIAKAKTRLEQALQNAIEHNVRPFLQSARNLTEEGKEVEVEVSFGLVMTGELGNVAVGKAGGEANYTITLRWTQSGESKQ